MALTEPLKSYLQKGLEAFTSQCVLYCFLCCNLKKEKKRNPELGGLSMHLPQLISVLFSYIPPDRSAL